MVVYQTDVVMDTDEITEQPIFSTKAHVFQIDPETKKNWVPASKTSISVAYYYDSSRDSYRIISVEGNKAIVNSTITPGMTFTKTSQKFGQWSDPRANTVYGLGFSTEADLAKFVEKFKEIKELTRNAALHHPPLNDDEVNGTSDITTPPSQPSLNHQVLHQRTNSLSSLPQGDGANLRERRNSFTQGSNSVPQATSSEAQLKYENDRLKLALAQSSSNAKKWEVELQTLKNNNARLTAALQESTSNVEEWKKQLAAYREENSRMKKKVSELDGGASEEQTSSLQQEVEDLKEHVEQLQEQNSLKEEELSELRLQMEELSTKESKSSVLQSRIQNLEEENHTLSLKVQDLQRLLNDSQRSQDSENRELLTIQAQLGNKITELYELHEQIVSVVKKESTS